MTSDGQSILVIGRDGQVARSLDETLSASGYHVVQIGRPETDLRNPSSVSEAIRAAQPDFIVNAAAYTAVDQAEVEPETAFAINAAGAQSAAEAASEIGAPIIHFSTDYVFDGSKGVPYVETDAVSPLGVYGESKLAGESLVAEANPKHIILRTAWVFSPFGSNFVKTMLRLSRERPEINVVDDQRGSPTYAPDLATTVCQIISRLRTLSPSPECFGTFHATNSGETSWYGFARAIIDGAARRGGPQAIVRPIPTSAFPTKAHRPAYSVLSNDKLSHVYGIKLRPWPDALSEALDRIIGARHQETPQRPKQGFDSTA